MCNLAEYIVARRAMHIVCCLSNPDCEEAQESGHYRSLFMNGVETVQGNDNVFDSATDEEAINMQQRLQDVFTLCVEGSTLKRFVGVNTTSENVEPEATPMFLLEVFEPSHAWIPIYITNRSVLMVSPFRNPMIERFGGSPYIYELFPTSLIRECRTFVDVNKALFEPLLSDDRPVNTPHASIEYSDHREGEIPTDTSNNPSFADVIVEAIQMFACGIQNSDRMLSSMGNTEIPASKVTPVSMESMEIRVLKSKYGVESMQHFENAAADDDGVIGKADYMPIYISDKEDHGPAVYTTSDEEGVLKIKFKPTVGGVMLNQEEVVGVLTKENLKYGNIYIIELDDNCYYVGKGKIGCCDEEDHKVSVEPLFSYMFNEGDDVAVSEDEYGIGTESAVGSVTNKAKAFALICKRFGIKTGSYGYQIMRQYLKLPTQFAKWFFNVATSAFKRGNELEKAETLELQEKLLNDELDIQFEKLRLFSEVHIKTTALAAALGSIWWFIPAWLIQRSRTRKARQRAMDRLELKIDGAIDRLKRKINHAEERSDNEAEDALLKELQMYKLAKMKLLEIKQKSFGGKRIKYATFDKDLTMTASQRIGSLLKGEVNPEEI